MGIERKNCLSINIPKGLNNLSKISEPCLLIRCRVLISWYWGIMVTCPGIIRVARNIMNILSLWGKLIFDRAYAPREHTKSWPIVEVMAILAVL
jgi:hypothetical protein